MFIVFEGGEGAGKSTAIKGVAEELRRRGYKIVVTKEPGGGLGKEIDEFIKKKSSNITPLPELFLFLAERAAHIEKVIEPALRSGKLILCDRFYHSTFAYQGYGRGIPLELIEKADFIARQGLLPDIVFLLDLPEKKGLLRTERADRIEKEPMAFHKRVREGYLRLAEKDPTIRKIDATKPPEEVLQDILNMLLERLK
ncbi:dTMP kinase [bacterium]|nr:dTMP kinase [bacterium]MBU1600301.1 dTMP kinase [bacterium]